ERPDVTDEVSQEEEDRRDGAERDGGEERVHEDEEDRRAEQHRQRGGDLDDAAADEHPHLLDVVGEARQELPGLRLVVIAEREPLDARVEPLAEVERDALRGALGEVALREVEEAANQRDAEEAADRAEDDRPAPAREAAVDGDANHLRRRQVGGRHAEEGEGRARGLPAVAAEVPERAPHGARTAGRRAQSRWSIANLVAAGTADEIGGRPRCQRMAHSWLSWRRYFEKHRERRLPDLHGATRGIPALWLAPLRASLATFQLGESKGGRLSDQIEHAELRGIDD